VTAALLLLVCLGGPAFGGQPPKQPARDRCAVSTAVRAAAEAECVGRVAEEVRFTGCPASICFDDARKNALVSLTDLDARVVEEGAFDRTVARLKKTGYFRDAVLSCVPSGGGVAVTVDVCPNGVVQSVKITGNRYFRERDLRKRVFLRPGQVLNVDPAFPNENEEVQRQILAIKRLYAREGVALKGPPRITVVRSGEIGLDLTLRVDEANRDGVREVTGRHVQSQRGSGKQRGCPDVDPDTIEDLIGFSSGDIVSTRARKQAEKKLQKWFRSVGFVSPQADVQLVEGAGGAMTLLAEVTTTTCWELRVWDRDAAVKASNVPAYRFRDPVGQVTVPTEQAPYRRQPLDDWRQTLPFAESGVFDRSEAARGLGSIEGRMEAQGFFFAEVRMEHRPFKNTRGPLLGRIDYFITKNYERRLQGITFKGLKSFDQDTINGVVQTRSYAFLDGASYLQVAKVMDDLALLERFYRSRGFYRFKYLITGTPQDKTPQRITRREGDWFVWEYRFRDRGFLLKKHIGDTQLYLEIPLDEGPRTRIGTIGLLNEQVVGTGQKPPELVLDRKQLDGLLTLKQGKPYGTEALQKDVRAIVGWYRKKGFHEARVTVTCEAFEPEPMDDLCDVARVQGNKVDLVFRVQEGRRFTVGEVFWRGNFRTEFDILTRDLPTTGEPFNVNRVNDALRRMRQLGIFNAAKVDIIGLDESPPRSKVALVVSVEEAPARFLDLTLSFRNIDRPEVGNVPAVLANLVGQSVATSDRMTTGLARPGNVSLPDLLLAFGLEYVDSNVLGLGQELRIPVEYGLSTLSPIRLARITPTWTIPWRIGDQDLRVQWSLTAVLSDQVTQIADFAEFAAGVTLTLPLPNRMVVAMELSGGANSFAEPDAPVHPIEGPYDPLFRLALQWRWDQQDNPLNPRKGFALNLQASTVLATAIDFGVLGLQEYVKWEASARAAIDFSAFVLAGYFRYGGSTASDARPLPLRERYSLGGSNGMRGFPDNAVGRYDQNGDLIAVEDGDILDTGGNVLINFNVELRFPLIPDIWLWGVVFSDIGALAATHAQLYPSSFRFSAGVGLRLLLFDQIPVRLDFGFPIDSRCAAYVATTSQPDTEDKDTEEERVCARTDDTFNFHLNVLYPF